MSSLSFQMGVIYDIDKTCLHNALTIALPSILLSDGLPDRCLVNIDSSIAFHDGEGVRRKGFDEIKFPDGVAKRRRGSEERQRMS